MKVTYVGPVFDSSGYAEAARNYICALDQAGIDVCVRSIKFERQKPDLGEFQEKLDKCMAKQDDSKIQISHLTPENYPRVLKRGRYNIAYTAWETSRVPDHWVPLLNNMDEIWVPCTHNVKVMKDSGVMKPVIAVPHTFKEPKEIQKDSPIQYKDEEDFMFYSIFQWTERKNPIGLLKAYLSEFLESEKVCLVLKTYFVNPDNPKESEQMKELIKAVKDRSYLNSFPKLLLISSLLSTEEMQALHSNGDCYVSLHRCEGFGIPIVEAMMQEKPTIVTNYGGPEDFNPDVMKKIGYTETPCHGMPWPTYHSHMNWAEPDILEARRAMRELYEDQKKAKEMGQAAKQWAKEEFSYKKIGNLMKTRLEEIEKELQNG